MPPFNDGKLLVAAGAVGCIGSFLAKLHSPCRAVGQGGVLSLAYPMIGTASGCTQHSVQDYAWTSEEEELEVYEHLEPGGTVIDVDSGNRKVIAASGPRK